MRLLVFNPNESCVGRMIDLVEYLSKRVQL